MERRRALKTICAGAAASLIAAPAIAQTAPEIRWRLTSSFPRNLDTIYGAAESLSRAVQEASDGRFLIQVFAAGDIVPGLQAFDAVAANSVEMAHTASSYYVGKDPAFAFGSVVPFALNARQMNAWLDQGGNDLLNVFYERYGIYNLPGGNTGCQMAGWYRREVRTVADLRGLKIRIPGLQGQVMLRLGAIPQQIAGGDVYSSLERGTIDAAEWVGPYDDEKLGFVRVAPYYYYPGWWEGGPSLNFFINLAKWRQLPARYQSILTSAAARANGEMLARYDARNPAALRRLVAAGAQLRPFAPEILDAAFQVSEQLLEELSRENAQFKTLRDSMMAFRREQYLWWQVAEFNFDAFMVRARPRF